MHFADPANQDTRGIRGKTTRRHSTMTVLGPEGAYIAQVKEELANRSPGWLVMVERVYFNTYGERRSIYSPGRFDHEADAVAYAATIPVGPETAEKFPLHTTYAVRVWVEPETRSNP